MSNTVTGPVHFLQIRATLGTSLLRPFGRLLDGLEIQVADVAPRTFTGHQKTILPSVSIWKQRVSVDATARLAVAGSESSREARVIVMCFILDTSYQPPL